METIASRLSTGRLEAFSDGVFAIAITLIVLEINLPENAGNDLVHALLNLWPDYLAYLTSFAAIGLTWVIHHWVVGSLRYVDTAILRINLILLMLIAFLPFPTELMGRFLDRSGPERVATIFYGLWLLVTKGALAAMWRYASRHRELLKENVTDVEFAEVGRVVSPNVGLIAFATALAIVAPQVAAAIYFAVTVIALVRTG